MHDFFPNNYSWSLQIIRILGHVPYQGGEASEILEATSRIKVGDYESFHQEWMRLGLRTLMKANEAMDQGRTETARNAYLRGSNYIRTAEFYLTPQDPRKVETYMKGVDAFRKGAELLPHPPQIIEIPYEGSFLTGYYFKAPDQEEGPAVVMFGGLDSTAEELYFSCAQIFNERGISLVAVDGPGQGGSLRLNGIHSRYDFEVAGTAVYDWTVANLDVDPDRIGICGVSMGGYMAARVAAFEPRYKCCAVFGANFDYHKVWISRGDNNPLGDIVQHVVGANSMEEAREKLEKFNLRGVAEQIKIPTFIIHGEDDRNISVNFAYELYNRLTCPRWLHIVPTSSTGSAHCQVDNPTEAFPMYDWIKEHLNS
jgi:dipeptidyl aminopeptidase/acylaminoacyl peptidase